jgi:hypothetical protein
MVSNHSVVTIAGIGSTGSLLIVSAIENGIGPNMSSAGVRHERQRLIIASPSSRSPDQQPRIMTNDWPRSGSGTMSIGGKFIIATDEVRRSSMPATQSRHRAMTSAAISIGYSRLPAYTVVTGYSSISIEVTTPKVPAPPPFNAQNSSPFSSRFAFTSSPSGVTSSNERTLSLARP